MAEVRVPKAVLDGLEAVRQSDLTNMLDRPSDVPLAWPLLCSRLPSEPLCLRLCWGGVGSAIAGSELWRPWRDDTRLLG